jgi:hypothetical protein
MAPRNPVEAGSRENDTPATVEEVVPSRDEPAEELKGEKNPPNLTGAYEREDCAYLSIQEIGGGGIEFYGYAEWVRDAEMGAVNVGELEGTAVVKQGRAEYLDEGTACGILMEFFPDRVSITEVEGGVCGGLNVSLSGDYFLTAGNGS